MHVVPSQPAPVLCSVSHWLRQPPQCEVELSDDSHPLVSGGVVSQSAQPAAQLL
jgi:hypothetical protein